MCIVVISTSLLFMTLTAIIKMRKLLRPRIAGPFRVVKLPIYIIVITHYLIGYTLSGVASGVHL